MGDFVVFTVVRISDPLYQLPCTLVPVRIEFSRIWETMVIGTNVLSLSVTKQGNLRRITVFDKLLNIMSVLFANFNIVIFQGWRTLPDLASTLPADKEECGHGVMTRGASDPLLRREMYGFDGIGIKGPGLKHGLPKKGVLVLAGWLSFLPFPSSAIA